TRVGDVVEARPGGRRAGEDERLAGGLADRGRGGQRRADVHQVADGVADDGVRAVYGPAEAEPLAVLRHDVLELVIEVLLLEPRHVFAKWRDGDDLAIVLERAEIVLGSRDDRGVDDAGFFGERIEHR